MRYKLQIDTPDYTRSWVSHEDEVSLNLTLNEHWAELYTHSQAMRAKNRLWRRWGIWASVREAKPDQSLRARNVSQRAGK